MSEQVKDLKEVVVFLGHVVTAIDTKDYTKIITLITEGTAAVNGFTDISLDLTEDQVKEVNEAFAEAFDIANDKAEVLVEKALSILANIYFMIKNFKAE